MKGNIAAVRGLNNVVRVLFEDLLEVLDPEPHSAALNMARDEALVRTATCPVLRCYSWERPAVSFGYFEKWLDVARHWPNRELVRRWTGGGVVPHGDDLTYTLVVPSAHPFLALTPLQSYRAIHAALATVLDSATLAQDSPAKSVVRMFRKCRATRCAPGGGKNRRCSAAADEMGPPAPREHPADRGSRGRRTTPFSSSRSAGEADPLPCGCRCTRTAVRL